MVRAFGCSDLAYAIHRVFNLGRAPFVNRHTFVVGIVDESDVALRQRYGLHVVSGYGVTSGLRRADTHTRASLVMLWNTGVF